MTTTPKPQDNQSQKPECNAAVKDVDPVERDSLRSAHGEGGILQTERNEIPHYVDSPTEFEHCRFQIAIPPSERPPKTSKIRLDGSGVAVPRPEALDDDEGSDSDFERAATALSELSGASSSAKCALPACPPSSSCLPAMVDRTCVNTAGATTAAQEIPEAPQMKATAIQARNRLSFFDRLNAAFLFSNSVFNCGWRMSDIVIGGRKRAAPRFIACVLLQEKLRFPNLAQLIPIQVVLSVAASTPPRQLDGERILWP